MQILNLSTSAKPVMTKLQTLLVALVIMDIPYITLKFSLLTKKCNFCRKIFSRYLSAEHIETVYRCITIELSLNFQ